MDEQDYVIGDNIINSIKKNQPGETPGNIFAEMILKFQALQIAKEEEKKMGKYRMYANGIYGKRYKGYYISKEDDGTFKFVDENNNVIKSGLGQYDDAEWEIDKLTASDTEMEIYRLLYDKPFYFLAHELTVMDLKKQKTGLGEAEEDYVQMIYRVRNRRAKDKEF